MTSKEKSTERAQSMVKQYADLAIELHDSDAKAAELATERMLDWLRYMPET